MLYKHIKPPLVDEHPFPLTGFVCKTAHVTFGGDGIGQMPERSCLTNVVSGRDLSKEGSNVTAWTRV